MNPNNPMGILIVIAVLLPLFYFRLRRMSKAQPLKWQYLWVRPAMILVAAGLVMASTPPGPADLPWLALAAVLGGVAGWHLGCTVHIEMHPQNGTLMGRSSPAGMMVMVVLVLLRLGLKSGAQMETASWHLNLLLITDASIVFSALLFSVRGLEMYLRAKRVMAAPPPI